MIVALADVAAAPSGGIPLSAVTMPVVFFVTSIVGILSIAWGAFKVLSGVRDQITSLGDSLKKDLSDIRVEMAREYPTKREHDRVESRLGKLENRVTGLESVSAPPGAKWSPRGSD